jgi:hypothetical protein
MATAAPRVLPLAQVRPDLPRVLTEVVEQAMAPEPRARHDSVAQFRARLLDTQRAPLQLQRGHAALPAPVAAELARAA